MIAADSSVAVGALLAWHSAHDDCRHAARGASIPAHALAETYAVLTRLPGALSATDAGRLLAAAYEGSRVLVPSAKLQRGLPAECARKGVSGGAVYDALVGLTAKEQGASLLTRDRRALLTYERLGVDVVWV